MTDDGTAHQEREDRVDRQALGDAVKARRDELGLTQRDLERESGVSVATIRLIENSQGTRHYRSAILSDLSRGLNWPTDRLQRIFYRMPEQDPVTPSGVELVTQAMMAQLKPYLAQIDAIDKRQSLVMEAIHHINSRIDAVLGPSGHSPEDG